MYSKSFIWYWKEKKEICKLDLTFSIKFCLWMNIFGTDMKILNVDTITDKHRRYNIIKDYYLAGRSQCIPTVRDIQIWCDWGSSSHKLENKEWNPGHLPNSCLAVWCDVSLTIWEWKCWYSLLHHFKDQNIKRKSKLHEMII